MRPGRVRRKHGGWVAYPPKPSGPYGPAGQHRLPAGALQAIRAMDRMKWQLANRPTVVATGAVAAAGQTAEAIVLDGENEVARASGFPGMPMSIAIPNVKLSRPIPRP